MQKEERTSETQLIKYVPGSTDKECVVAFGEYLYFFFEFWCRYDSRGFGVGGGNSSVYFRQTKQACKQKAPRARDRLTIVVAKWHAGRTDYFRFE